MLIATKHTWLTNLDSQHEGSRNPQPFKASKNPEGAPMYRMNLLILSVLTSHLQKERNIY